jgi:prepilin-type N-terminal cleavage/methylation domain-containing protein
LVFRIGVGEIDLKKGFSLIEIVCVISIIGVVSSIAYPLLNIFIDKNKLNAASYMLVNDLRFAKMHAISKNSTAISVFFVEDEEKKNYNGYYIYDPTNYSAETLKKVRLSEGIVISKIESTFEQSKIKFQTNGSVSPHACSIVLRNFKTGQKSTITLTIGFTRIMEVKR